MATLAAIVQGLKIIGKHEPNGDESNYVSTDHDVIYAGTSRLPSADAAKLIKLGWNNCPSISVGGKQLQWFLPLRPPLKSKSTSKIKV